MNGTLHALQLDVSAYIRLFVVSHLATAEAIN